MNQWSLEPVFGWIAVVPLAIVMIASLWFTLTAEGIGWLGRLWLLLLRLLAIALLMLGWLRPGLITTVDRDSAAAVGILVDASQSMTLPSGDGDLNRWAVAVKSFKELAKESKSGFDSTRFIPYVFDANLRPIVQGELAKDLTGALDTQTPQGMATDLGSALAELQRAQVDPPLRAVFMLTDGTQTVVPAPSDPTLTARQLAQLDQPLIMVGIGPRSENSQLRDLAIEGTPEHVTAFEKNRVAIPAVVKARGMQNAPISVSLTLKSSGQPDIPLKAMQIVASKADQTIPLDLEVEAPKSGEYLLEVHASVDGKELIVSNNSTFTFITVRAGGSRILYLEGQPRYEQKFLRHSLDASLDFQVQYRWIERIARWPIDITKDPNFEAYDAFILGDIDSKALGNASLAGLRKRVEAGAGLLTLGGFHSYDAGGYAGTPLADVLPIQLVAKPQSFDGPINTSMHIAGPLQFLPAIPHPITRLAMEPDNTQIWNSLKPLLGANRFGKVKVQPGVNVLAKTANEEPLLVTGEFGRGRVLCFAGDSTYQWWTEGQKLRHKQFWRQSLLWLLGRDSLQEGFRIALDRRRLMRGEEEPVSIEWVPGSDNKPMPQTFTLELIHEGKWLRNLDSQPSGENRRQTRLTDLKQPGLYRLLLKAKSSDGKDLTSDVAFIVRDESRELTTPTADWPLMQNMVAATEVAGGRLITPDEIPEVMDWLRKRQLQSRVTTVEKRRLGDGLWDAWLYFALFCGLMTLEWATRKRWQLP